MPSLSIVPNPPPPGITADLTGAGFPKKRLVQVKRNGAEIAELRTTGKGTFGPIGCIVPDAPSMTLTVHQGTTVLYTKVIPIVKPPVDPPPPTVKSVTVASVAALKSTLADDTVDEIVVTNGTYVVAPASSQAVTSLWIGSQYAARTRPITVRAEASGGVTFDGGGSQGWGGISFQDGAHHQTWDGFRFANGRPASTGVVMFGGYRLPAAHHITLRNITMLPSITGPTPTNQDHCMYFSNGGTHDILVEDYTVTPGPNIQSALQFHHGADDGTGTNAYNVTVRRMHVVGTQSTILIYESSVHDVLIEDFDIVNARDDCLNVNACGPNVVIRNGTGNKAPYYPSGKPAGLTVENCVWA